MLPKEVDSTGSTSVDSRKYEYMSPQVQVYRFVKYNPEKFKSVLGILN
jgi:hypothetical protein